MRREGWRAGGQEGKGASRGQVVLLVLSLVLLLSCPLAAQCPDGTPPPCGRPASRPVAPAPTSVAVLYFDNLSRDSSDTYLAEGLTDELITRLGQVERLQVKSRNAVRRFRGDAAQDPAAVGRALGVAHLVSGSVRRTGPRVRVTVELTRAATGAHVWGDTYQRTDSDLMTVESDVASAIATAVGGRLAPAERQTLTGRPTSVPAAYDHLLRGDFLLAHRTGPDARRALAEYEAAVGLDSGFARAWARLGLEYFLFLDWDWDFPGLSRDSLLVRGVAAADRATAIDPLNADGWLARGKLQIYQDPLRFEGAMTALERAVRLEARNAEAWHQLGGVLSLLGRDDDAVTAFQRSLALDPQRMITLANLSEVYIRQGRDRDALPLLDSAAVVGPDSYYPHVLRGFVRLRLGDRAGAEADADTALRLRAPDRWADPLLVAVAMARSDTVSARVRAERLAGTLAGADLGPGALVGGASAFALLGVTDRAMALLERARSGGIITWSRARDPVFASVRGDPRYQRLLRDLRPPEAR